MKVSLPRVSIPKRNSLVIIIAALVVAGVLAASIVHFENVQRQKNAQAKQAAVAQAQRDKNAQDAINSNAQLQQEVLQATQDKVAVCNTLRAASKPKAPIAIPKTCL